MTFSITQYQNSSGTDTLASLDNNFATISAQAPIPCAVSGTNVLSLTPNAVGQVPSVPLTGYTNGMVFSGVAAATNNGAVTASVGSLPVLNVYKDTLSGPATCSAQEITSGNAFSLKYDSALNTGAGGFHLVSTTAISFSAINPLSLQINAGDGILTGFLSGTVALTFTATPGWSSQDQSFTLSASAVPAPGDFVQVNPPSLAATGVGFNAMVLAGNASLATVNIRLLNAASASLASNSGIYRWLAMRTTF